MRPFFRLLTPFQVLAAGVAVPIAVCCAYIVVYAPRPLAVATPAILVSFVLLGVITARHGIVSLLAVAIAFPLAGLNPAIAHIGTADLRVADLLVGVLVLFSIPRVFVVPRSTWRLLVPFVVLCAAILANSVLVATDATAVLSALRLISTFSLAVFMAILCRSRDDLRLVLQVAAIALAIGVLLALAQGADGANRFGYGLLGPNMLSLAGAFLVVMGITGAVSSRRLISATIVVTGLTGLALGKSVGTLVALAAALALIYGVSGKRVQIGRVVLILVLLMSATIVVVGAFRPTSLPWNPEFRVNSGQQRLMQAYAGIQVFLGHPVLGVGWMQSGRALTDSGILADVQDRLGSPNRALYPNVGGGGVHSAYVQMAAELGLVGLTLLAWLGFQLIVAAGRIVRESDEIAGFVVGSVSLMALWFNETALFGGQPETHILSLVVGSAAVALATSHQVADSIHRGGSALTRATT